MRRVLSIALLLILVAVSLTACGGSVNAQQKQQAKQEAAKFEAKAKKCLPTKAGAPDLTVLRSKSGRHTFTACLVPPSERAAFNRCATSAIIGHFSKAKIEAGLSACLAKVS